MKEYTMSTPQKLPKELKIKPAYPHFVASKQGDPLLIPPDLRHSDDKISESTLAREVSEEEFRKEQEGLARLLAEVAKGAYSGHL